MSTWSERTRRSARPVSFSSAVSSKACKTTLHRLAEVLVTCEVAGDFLKEAVRLHENEQTKENAHLCGVERCRSMLNDALESGRSHVPFFLTPGLFGFVLLLLTLEISLSLLLLGQR